jgi:hypothetical protein
MFKKSLLILTAFASLTMASYAKDLSSEPLAGGQLFEDKPVRVWDFNNKHVYDKNGNPVRKYTHLVRRMTPVGEVWKDQLVTRGYTEAEAISICQSYSFKGNRIPTELVPPPVHTAEKSDTNTEAPPTGTLATINGSTFGTYAKEDAEHLIDIANSQDSVGLLNLYVSGKGITLNKDTKVDIIEADDSEGVYRVQVKETLAKFWVVGNFLTR